MQNKSEQYKDAKATSYSDVPAGGYVVEVSDVTDMPNKEYLRIELDIIEGEYANYYSDLFSRAGFWGLTLYKSYKDKSLGWFKDFMETLEKCNDGFKWDWDEKKLIGCTFGAVLREEEYQGNDGTVKSSLKVDKYCSVQDIHDGNFKVKPIKKLAGTAPSAGVVNRSASAQAKPDFKEIPDDNIPF